MHLCMHVYILYIETLNPSILKSADLTVHVYVCSMVIASWSDICDTEIWALKLVGLPPKLKLLAVFTSSDTVVGMYTVGHTLL